MRLFEPFAHMTWRTAGEYRAMSQRGVRALVEPAACPGQPRAHAGSVEDYFASLLGWEPHRAAREGVRHHCALGLGPREVDDEGLAASVLWLLPRLLDKDGAVAVGELGFEEFSRAEDDAFLRQAELARDRRLPVIVRACPVEGPRSVERAVALLREVRLPERQAVVVGLKEESLPRALDSGVWAGISLHPRYGLGAKAATSLALRYAGERLLIGSGADWDDSDALSLPAAARALERAGLEPDQSARLFWDNPASFYGQSGRLDLSPAAPPEALSS